MDLLNKIHACENSWYAMLGEKKTFNKNMDRWHNDVVSDRYDCNAFIPHGTLTSADIEEAFTYQKERGDDFIQFFCKKPLEKALAEKYQLEENIVITMALQNAEPDSWKRNDSIVIKDVQSHDIAAEILAFHLEQEKEEFGDSDFPLRSMTQDLKATKENPNYHWIAAYLGDEVVGLCHALCHSDCVEVDDLVVASHVRKQYVATTMFCYIAEHFKGQLYLHADEDDTPKEMYAKMGFTTVDTCWEYRRVGL